ncbi:MAG: threonine/serine exporter family protein, partial [Bacteroidaceae bacterium]|nr:threonine/serine exporter family protein [Bacteroidaceae bacterium]
MDLNALDIASQAGHIMLENGAEISRVEEVMERIASSFGADSRKFFVLSNGIFTTGKGYANVEFIPIHGSQLDKVIEVNQLSRDIEAGMYTIEEAYEKLKLIRGIPPHPVWEQLLGSALGSAAFCAIFGGGLADCALSLVSGVLLWIFVLYVSMPCFSKVTGNLVGGILVTIFSIVCYNFGIGHLDNILIGAIIPLIPG